MDINVTKTFKYSRSDFEDIISSAFEDGIAYWAGLDNSTKEWEKARKNNRNEYPTLDEIAYDILDGGKNIVLYDIEDDKERWEFGWNNLISGIEQAIANDDWNGDIDDLDANIADIIFQYGLWNEVVYG